MSKQFKAGLAFGVLAGALLALGVLLIWGGDA
jgi:hypothetical protein